MKVVGVRDARRDFIGYMRRAQYEPVLVTRHGRPSVIIRGVEGEDLEDLLTASDPAFWRMIEARRRRPIEEHIPLADVRRRLARGRQSTRRRRVKSARPVTK